jgi:aconitate hydratase
VVVHHADGSADAFPARHTLSEEHIGWFRAGSALNMLAATVAQPSENLATVASKTVA